MRILLSLFLISFLSPLRAFADDGMPHDEVMSLSDQIIHLNAFPIALWSFGIILLLMIIAAVLRTDNELLKKLFFWPVVVISVLVTGLFLSQTTLKNIASDTGGPVHWHADFRIFNCYEEIDIIDPTGFLNRVGTPTVHEHGDKRMHVEGTMLDLQDASLGHFFEVIGGELTQERMLVPTNLGMEEMNNGEVCPTKKDQEAVVQVFLWEVEDGVARQRKLENFADYVISPYSPVPSGDCVIFEFGPEKDATTHLCEQYSVAESKEKLIIEKAL